MDPSTDSGVQPFGAADMEALKAKDDEYGIAVPASEKTWDGPIAAPGSMAQDGPLLSVNDPYQTRGSDAVGAGAGAGLDVDFIENGVSVVYTMVYTRRRVPS